MKIVTVKEKIPIADLEDIAREFYHPMVKGVVDIEEEIAAFGGEYHIDANQKLIECNLKQKNIWGFNVHLDQARNVWIEYVSLINIRPDQNNFDMEVADPQIRAEMKRIIDSKII